MDPSRRLLGPLATAAATLAALSSCGPSHHLNEYDFRGSLVASVVEAPTYPEIITGPMVVQPARSKLGAIIQTGSAVARRIAVEQAQHNLERAAERVDMPTVMEDEALRRATRILGAEAGSEGSADFSLEIEVRRYGIEATDWQASAYYFVEGEARLVDRRRGRRVWHTKVEASAPVGPEVYAANPVRNIVTAAVVAGLSEDDMIRALRQLSGFTAASVTDRLRDDLFAARR